MQVVEKCTGCAHVIVTECNACPIPAAKWRIGNCNMATHLKKAAANKVFVDPLKASKQAMKKRGK